jgi:putative nucleotidyltransferase with HDIG domain
MDAEDMVPLPQEVCDLLEKLDAPPRLIAHLTVVHHVARELTHDLAERWPDLPYNQQAVLLGAATHDIGKVVHRDELRRPGQRHEEAGVVLLRQHGFSSEQARFARTHGQRHNDPAVTPEDLLVALADTIWKGKRDEHLEATLVRHIAQLQGEEPWVVYLALDEIIQPIAQQANTRLTWHGQHPD